MDILEALAGLSADAAGSIRFRGQITLGGLVFPEPVTITPHVEVASTVRHTLAPLNSRRDPVVNYSGISAVHVNLDFMAANWVSPAVDSKLGEGAEGIPGYSEAVELGSSLFGLLEVWSMRLEEFIPRLMDLYDNQPAPWPITDTGGALLSYNIQYVTPTEAPRFMPINNANNLYQVSLPLIRQNPYQNNSIFRQVAR